MRIIPAFLVLILHIMILFRSNEVKDDGEDQLYRILALNTGTER